MNHSHKLTTPSILKWVSSIFPGNHLISLITPCSSCQASFYIAKIPIFFSSRAGNNKKDQTLDEETLPNSHSLIQSRRDRKRHAEAQSVLLENLYGMGSLLFSDAEHMSKNCPNFIHKLLQQVEDGQEIGRSLKKLFRYHPINEFEPFLESMGLSPSEVSIFLPRKLMYLRDDPLMLQNYHVLCNYGVPRSLIGKFYKEAHEVFRYEPGVLHSKLEAFGDLGLSRYNVIKVVSSGPSLLIGSNKRSFAEVLDLLNSSGIEFEWIVGGLSDKDSYVWDRMLGVLKFIFELGFSKEELQTLMRRNPGLLSDGSGKDAFLLVVHLLKFGFTMKELSCFLLQLPQLQLGIFVNNLRQGFHFLMEIEMDAKDIGNIVRQHPVLLGSSPLKKSRSIRNNLNARKKKLCDILKEDPCQLKNWVLGKKVEPLPRLGKYEKSTMKTEFLLKLNFIENSDEFNKAVKMFRGQGGELQERFDCILKAGLDQEEVIDMIKRAPQVLNQTKEVIQKKIDFLLNEAHYPVSSLVPYPSYLSYTLQRIKLRFAMYTWLQDEGLAAPRLGLCTIVACTEECFIRHYVNRHPKGLEVWENLKKELCV